MTDLLKSIEVDIDNKIMYSAFDKEPRVDIQTESLLNDIRTMYDDSLALIKRQKDDESKKKAEKLTKQQVFYMHLYNG